MEKVSIRNISKPLSSPIRADFADAFFGKLKGLMFRKEIDISEGLLIVEPSESRMNTAIHMLFMNFDIAAIWIDSRANVVDTCLAKKWHPFYIPHRPAQFVLEVHPQHLSHFLIGDQVEIQHEKVG